MASHEQSQESKKVSQEEEQQSIEFLSNVLLSVSVEMGEAQTTIGEFLRWKPGSVLTLDKRDDEPFDFRVNGKLVATGEVVVVNEHYGVRITNIIDPDPV